MTGDTSEPGTERIEKTLVALPSALEIGNIEDEIALAAVDSVPELDQRTIRTESVEKTGECYEIVISGRRRDRRLLTDGGQPEAGVSRPSAHDLLTRAEGIGPETADRLLAHFETGREVARAASRGWGKLLDVEGFSEKRAKQLFDDLREAGVYEDLKYGRYSDASRPDAGISPTGYNFAYTFGTIVDGRVISIRGYDVTDTLRQSDSQLPWEYDERGEPATDHQQQLEHDETEQAKLPMTDGGTQETEYRYGNGTVGYYETRHEAIGAAAIRARKDPFPFGEGLEVRSPDERRRDILRRCRWIYVRAPDHPKVQRANDELNRSVDTGTDQPRGGDSAN